MSDDAVAREMSWQTFMHLAVAYFVFAPVAIWAHPQVGAQAQQVIVISTACIVSITVLQAVKHIANHHTQSSPAKRLYRRVANV